MILRAVTVVGSGGEQRRCPGRRGGGGGGGKLMTFSCGWQSHSPVARSQVSDLCRATEAKDSHHFPPKTPFEGGLERVKMGSK